MLMYLDAYGWELILQNNLLYFAWNLSHTTFSDSNTPHFWSTVSYSFSDESLRYFVQSLSYTVPRCTNKHDAVFYDPEFPIFYAITTSLHYNWTCRVHDITGFMTSKYLWAPSNMLWWCMNFFVARGATSRCRNLS